MERGPWEILNNSQKGHMCLQRHCSALKTLKSKVNSVKLITDNVTY